MSTFDAPLRQFAGEESRESSTPDPGTARGLVLSGPDEIAA
jgi:hypothetical protein